MADKRAEPADHPVVPVDLLARRRSPDSKRIAKTVRLEDERSYLSAAVSISPVPVLSEGLYGAR